MSASKPSDWEVRGLVESAPSSIPASYPAFLVRHGALEFCDPRLGHVVFWPLAEVLALNAAYGFAEFAPELFGFGSDGGGELYVFDLRTPDRPGVGRVPAVPLSIGAYVHVARDFEAFASQLRERKRL